MKIEVLVTLKGNVGEMFRKGDVFESPNIPDTLLVELGAGAKTVRRLDDPIPDPAPALDPPSESKKKSRLKRA